MIRYELHLVCPQTLKLSQGLSLLLFNPSNSLSQNRKCSQMKSGDDSRAECWRGEMQWEFGLQPIPPQLR